LTSNFSAEEQKGPMVITSVTKAGGTQFHGEGFFDARNYVLNSNDAYFNATVVPKFPGGGCQMPASMIDPNMQALMKLYPAPNANPGATGGYNYIQSE